MFNMRLMAISSGLILAGAVGAMAAQPADRGPTPGLGWGPGGKGSVGTPAPVAGVGLFGIAVAGGVTYLVFRRRRKPEQADTQERPGR